jgi:hypothetical protein
VSVELGDQRLFHPEHGIRIEVFAPGDEQVSGRRQVSGGRDDHVYVARAIRVPPHLTQHAPDRPIGRHRIEGRPDRAKPVTAVGAIIHTRPSGYSFLPELQQCSCHQISIETAQSNLDCSVLSSLAGKKVMLGVIDLSDMQVESPAEVARRIRRALPFTDPRNIIVCTDCGMKYLPRDVAFGKMKAMVDGASIVRRELQLGT